MGRNKDYLLPKTEYVIKRREIPGFFTNTFWAQVAMWKSYKRLGSNVFGGGWADWPAVFKDVIEALEDENNKRLG